MRRSRLNLSALRARRLPRLLHPVTSAANLFDSRQSLTMTRRGLLVLAGAAAMALPLEAAADSRPFHLMVGRKRVVFRAGGSDKWIVDTRSFAANPKLTTTQSSDSIRIELKDARYPGTEIPADFICELNRGALGWRMHLQLKWGGFESRTPFTSWLTGEVPARSRVWMNSRVCGLGRSAGLFASGQAQAEFFPNWQLHVTGHEVARLSGIGGGAASDSLAVSLLSPGEASMLTRPPERRTLLAMQRRELDWPLGPEPVTQHSWNLVASGGTFDLLHIETGESSLGEPCRALLAESRGEGPSLHFAPGQNFTGDDGSAFHLGLRNARYAMFFDGTRTQSTLVADYDSEPAWLHTGGCSFEVGGRAGEPFELTMPHGSASRVRCAPPLRRVAAPLPGVMAEPGEVEERAQLAFAFGPEGAQAHVVRKTNSNPVSMLPRFPLPTLELC